MDKKTKNLIDRIRSLREMTGENGCTEAEAATAAAKAAELLEKYDLDEAAIEHGATADDIRKEETSIDIVNYPAEQCLGTIMRLTETIAMVSERWVDLPQAPVMGDLFGESGAGGPTHKKVRVVTFVGYSADIEVANYYWSICKRAIDGATAHWLADGKRGEGRERAKKRFDFQAGVANRMADTIRNLCIERERRREQMNRRANGRGLTVVSKHDAITSWLEDQGIAMGERNPKGRRYDAEAFGAGSAAGAGVAFNPGMSGGNGGRPLSLTNGRR